MTIVPPLDPQQLVPTPVPVSNLAPVATPLPSSTPSPVSTPVKDEPTTRSDVIVRAVKTFFQTAIPAIVVAYNAGGTPVTERHSIEAAIITAGSAGLSVIWNAGTIVFGARRDAQLQAAVKEYLAVRGLV